MVEEPLGPYERQLILLNKGKIATLPHGEVPTDGREMEEQN
jgi:hypothetical protein